MIFVKIVSFDNSTFFNLAVYSFVVTRWSRSS